MANRLYIAHKLTAYHLRDMLNRSKPYRLGICSCGWRARFLRPPFKQRARQLVCLIRGHRWDEPEEIHAGPVGFEESEDTLVGVMRQCDFCWKCRIA